MILTTTGSELDALLEVDTGAVPGTAWEIGSGAGGVRLAMREFLGHPRALRVAAATLGDMAEESAPVHTLVLASALEAQCVVVCGACSARGDKVSFGDLAVAERLLYPDPDRQLPERTQHDLAAYRLRDDWRAWLEGLDAVATFRDAGWLARRPLTTEWRLRRALLAFHVGVLESLKGVAPRRAVKRGLDIRAWRPIMRALRERRWLDPFRLQLSESGARELAELLREYGGELPDLSPTGKLLPFRIHVAPFHLGRPPADGAAGDAVVLHASCTPGVQPIQAAVLAALAHRQSQHQLDVVVLGSVMDIAGRERDDQLERFAERAAAECSLWLVRQRVAPRQADPE